MGMHMMVYVHAKLPAGSESKVTTRWNGRHHDACFYLEELVAQ